VIAPATTGANAETRLDIGYNSGDRWRSAACMFNLFHTFIVKGSSMVLKRVGNGWDGKGKRGARGRFRREGGTY